MTWKSQIQVAILSNVKYRSHKDFWEEHPVFSEFLIELFAPGNVSLTLDNINDFRDILNDAKNKECDTICEKRHELPDNEELWKWLKSIYDVSEVDVNTIPLPDDDTLSEWFEDISTLEK